MSKNSKTVVEKPAAKKAVAAKATKTAAKKVEAKSAAKATTKKAEVKEAPAKKAAPKAEKAVKQQKPCKNPVGEKDSQPGLLYRYIFTFCRRTGP